MPTGTYVRTKEIREKMSIACRGSHPLGISPTMGKFGSESPMWKGGKRISGQRKTAKRRILGFIPLNQPFDGADAHHIDKEHIVYTPHTLHASIPHNVWTGKNMEKINALVFRALEFAS